MDALELLTTRSSMPRLIEPAPTPQQLQMIRKAAIRVPDHMNLSPFRFIEFLGRDRQLLADIYQQAARLNNFSNERVEQAGQIPFRAPMIIATCLRYVDNEKVPRHEQYATVACATMAMQQACFAMGLGAIWRTGWLAEDDYVREQLGCSVDDEVVGFLYVGTPAVPTPVKPEQQAEPFFINGADIVRSE
jgi:nitroreductase